MHPVLRDPHHMEIVREVRRRRVADPEAFDRTAFAAEVLRLLGPPGWTVALYLRDHPEFFVDRGRDLRAGLEAVWAVVGIPADASRAEIAAILAELTGTQRVPFLVDLLASGEAPADYFAAVRAPA